MYIHEIDSCRYIKEFECDETGYHNSIRFQIPIDKASFALIPSKQGKYRFVLDDSSRKNTSRTFEGLKTISL